jgi:hypothetical protein
MSKKLLLIIGLVIVVSTAFIMYLLKSDEQSKIDKNAYISSEWKENFTPDDKNPNGTFLFNELLEYQTKKTSTKIDFKLDSIALSKKNTSYFFIGDKFQLTTNEFDSLMDQVYVGSNLFIAYNTISDNINSTFFNTEDFVWEFNESIDVYANNKNYRFYSVFQSDTVASEWNFFSKNSIKSYNFNEVKTESSVQGNQNFISLSFGEGTVFLHCNPKMFANYQLLTKTGFEYSQFVVSKIPKNHEIKWLELARFEEIESENNEDEGEGSGKEDSSYLQFIFQHKTLTIALLLSLLGIILFLIFRTKRSQPIVPYIPKSFNNSAIFADTIKEIYYRQQTPFSILQVIKKNFYLAVNKQFFVDISKEERTNEIHILHEKSGIEKEKINQLLNLLETKDESQVNFEFLNRVSKAQQDFYIQSGFIKSRLKQKIDGKSKKINRKMFFPILLIFGGIIALLISFYLLHNSAGSAIVLWPIGIVFLTFGIRLYALPILKISGEELCFYFLFKTKKRLKINELSSVEIQNGSSYFEFTSGEKFVINNGNISVYDLNSYEQFISTYLN